MLYHNQVLPELYIAPIPVLVMQIQVVMLIRWIVSLLVVLIVLYNVLRVNIQEIIVRHKILVVAVTLRFYVLLS